MRCVILFEQHVYAGPNNCRFIERPTEHDLHNKFRADETPPSPPSATTSSTSSSKNATTSSASLPRHKNQGCFIKKSNVSGSSYVILQETKTKCKSILIDKAFNSPTIQLKKVPQCDVDVWTKEFVLKTVHTGVNKLISNEANYEFYNAVIQELQGYHSAVLKGLK